MRPIHDVWSAALAALLSGLLPALAVAAAAWLLLKLTPRTNASTRHAVWWLVLALAVMLPAGFAVHDAGGRRQLAAAVNAASWAPTWNPSAGARAVAVLYPRRALPPAAVTRSSRVGALRVRAGGWAGGLLILWMAIFLVQLGRLGGSFVRLRGVKRRARQAWPELEARFASWTAACGIRRPVRLLVSDEVATPMAAGFLRPAVILPGRLPAEFGPTDLDHVLLHELSHLGRRDDWSNLLARVAQAAFWFNPAALWALRRIEREREMACDEWVVEATGTPRPYAASLARLFEFCMARRKEALAAGMAGHASHLGERIEVLVRRKGACSRRVSALRVAGCTAALLLLTAVAARTPRWVVLAQDPARPASASRASAVPAPPARTADPHSFLAAVVAAGYGDLSVDEIIQLRNSGVSGAYLLGVSRAGWGHLKTREIIDLLSSGVSPDFLRAVGEAAIPGATLHGVIALNQSGVTAAYILEVQAAGMGAFSTERIIELHNSGVRPALLAALRDAGFTHLDAREIIDAQNNGLGPKDLREARQYGSSLTLKQILRLKQAGVL
jgi:beta-lactamase regulating signal transducer with metallopeptidase domain